MANILGLGTATPLHAMAQTQLADLMIDALNLNSEQTRFYQKIGATSAIEQRHSVLDDFSHQLSSKKTFLGSEFPQEQPNLQQRNQRYQKEAPQLSLQAAKNAINNWGEDKNKITHIIVVSCTGVMVPGIDVTLIDALNLNSQVERFGIHFMGCFGAFKGLAAACALCHENPKNYALVVCVELCSLHFQASTHQDTLLSNLLFADGAAAVVLGYKGKNSICEIIKRRSSLLPNSRHMMSWEIGQHALEMHMTKEVPNTIRKHIKSFVTELLGDENFADVDFVIHPGGKAILHQVERACELNKQQTQASWAILASHGNMSSPTVLFILQNLLQRSKKNKIIMLGFGPGLTVEGIFCQRRINNVV